MNEKRRALLRVLLALGALPVAGCDEAGKPAFRNTDIGGANYGKEFALLDSDGKTWRLADFRGKAVLLFFGFIQCPDVCPTTLARAQEVRRLLGADGERLQIIFVTVDPERDTPEILRAYTAAFSDADVLGLYSAPEKTNALANAFRIYYRKVPTGSGSDYTVDHSAISYVYDPEGRLRLAVRHEASAESIAADVTMLLKPSSLK
ncbi:MAG: SCO family protein [Azoarcus sp.]|nr:SCO family protein [Azoarcus sp.]